MTITMYDVEVARSHETFLEYREQIALPRVEVESRWHRWLTASHWVDVATGVVLWGALLMAASGLGLLLEAIADTVRYGAPR